VYAVAQLSSPTTQWCVVGLVKELWATLMYTLMLRMLVLMVELLLLILLGLAMLLLLATAFVMLKLW
jgi:hypothetical protein